MPCLPPKLRHYNPTHTFPPLPLSFSLSSLTLLCPSFNPCTNSSKGITPESGLAALKAVYPELLLVWDMCLAFVSAKEVASRVGDARPYSADSGRAGEAEDGEELDGNVGTEKGVGGGKSVIDSLGGAFLLAEP